VNEYDPDCTPQDCSLEIYIESRAQELVGYSESRYRLFHLLGVRPWGVVVTFTIKDAKLLDSSIEIETVVFRQIGGTDCAVDLLYETVSRAPIDSFDISPYAVYRPHISSGTPTDALFARFAATDSAPTRAFDLDLRCLTAITSVCTHAQLAPSAWADYRSRN
jgi:hypothetical protein